MKSTCVICVLLGITISSLLLAEGIADTIIQASTSPLPNSTVKPQQKDNETTTSEPKTTTPTTTSTVTSNSTITSTNTPSTTTATPPETTKSTSTTPKTPTTPKSTTVAPITSTNATVTSTTISTSTSAVKTTAEPPTTSSPTEHRHFDGLSFFGGIILATCLMAIATFSWKFYRQCNERNYRTL
ncbi:Sialomucin core protein 24 [Camponotus japonicus]